MAEQIEPEESQRYASLVEKAVQAGKLHFSGVNGDIGEGSAGVLPAEDMERLNELAREHGWTVDSALRHALDIAEIVLDAKKQPDSEVYVVQDGKRYSLEVEA